MKSKKLKHEQAFGQILRKFRNKANLSQEKLAQESNLDRTYISLLERGLRQPSLSSILQLSKALNMSATDMVNEVENIINENSAN